MRGTQVLGQGTQVSGQGAQVSGQGAQEPGYSMLPSTAKWPESWTFDLVTLKGIKNALQNGITLGVLDFWKYIKRMDENC